MMCAAALALMVTDCSHDAFSRDPLFWQSILRQEKCQGRPASILVLVDIPIFLGGLRSVSLDLPQLWTLGLVVRNCQQCGQAPWARVQGSCTTTACTSCCGMARFL